MHQQVKQVEGALLEAGPDGIVGWARDIERPADLIRVVLSVGDEPLATVVADRFDIDIVRRQVGPGVAGFNVRLPHLPKGSPPFTVTARAAGGRMLGKSLTINTLQQMASCVAGVASPTLEGMVDLLSSGQLQGWLWDPAAPQKSLEVEVFDRKTLLGRVRAENFREDLKRAGKREGYCGFSLELPTSLLDMKPHSIRVVAADTSFELTNSPLQFGPLLVSNIVDELSRLRGDVDLLLSKLDAVTGADGKLQRELVQIMADRLSAYAAIQAEAVERRVDAALASLNESPPRNVPRRRS